MTTNKTILAVILGVTLFGSLSFIADVNAEMVEGWQVADTGGQVSELDGVITLSGDARAAGPNLYREFKPKEDFEVSFQLKAETLGEVHRDPAGAGEGFGFGFGTNNTSPSHGAAFEMRARAGGQFLLVWHDDLCDIYGWSCNWVPFIYNGIGYNDGSAYWHPNPPVDRSNSTVKPDVWYTVKLKVTETPFTMTAEVYTEEGTFLGSHMIDTINDFTFKEIRYIGMSSGHGGTFYVRNIKISSISPVAKFTFAPTEPAIGEGVLFNASESSLQSQIVDYFWDFGDNRVAHSIAPTYSACYTVPGIYNVTLAVTNIDGLKASYSQIIQVKGSTHISISAQPSCKIGAPISIYGNLTDYSGSALINEPVVLKYTFPGAEEWYPISSSFTNEVGCYSVQWINTATGTFTVRAEWKGNNTHPGVYTNMTLNSLPLQDNRVFFVESNSTVTSISFNSTTPELSFSVTGPTGTEGYVKITMAKSLVAHAENLKVTLDGNQLSYSLTENDDSWLLEFNYTHSTHGISVYFEPNNTPQFEQALPPSVTGSNNLLTVLFLAIIISLIGMLAIISALSLQKRSK